MLFGKMLTHDNLLRWIALLQQHPVDAQTPDEQLIAATECHLSLQQLVVALGLEAEYGPRNRFEQELEAIYRIGSQRCTRILPTAACGRMLLALDRNIEGRMGVLEGRRATLCRNRLYRFVDRWMEQPHPADPDPADWRSEQEVLRSLTVLLCGMEAEELADDPDYRYLRRRIDDWIAAADTPQGWSRLPLDEQLGRIELMQRNALLFADAEEDARIESLREALLQRAAAADTDASIGGAAHFRLYELLTRGIAAPSDELLAAWVDRARRLLEQAPRGSEAWYWALAICIDSACRQLHLACKAQLLAHIA